MSFQTQETVKILLVCLTVPLFPREPLNSASAGSVNLLSRRHQSEQLMANGFLTSAQPPEFLSDNADHLQSHLPNTAVTFTCIQQSFKERLSESAEVNYCNMIYNDFSIREQTVNVTNTRAADVDSCDVGVKSRVSRCEHHSYQCWRRETTRTSLCDRNSSAAVDSMLIWASALLVCVQRLQIHSHWMTHQNSSALWLKFLIW